MLSSDLTCQGGGRFTDYCSNSKSQPNLEKSEYEVDNQFTQTVGYFTIAKDFHSLLHNLHSSITKWSVSKNTDLLFLFVI